MYPIRWLTDFAPLHALCAQEGWLGDPYERILLQNTSPYLAFGAFDGPVCIGAITGFLHEKSAWISHFVVAPSYRGKGLGRKLFEHLLGILENESDTLYLHAAPQMEAFYASFGFHASHHVTRYVRPSSASTFFLQPTQEFKPATVSLKLRMHDANAFGERRNLFLEHALSHPSSLIFCTPSGYLHSRMMEGKYLFLGPWVTEKKEDAETFLNALLFFRGAKPIIADAPTLPHIASLYERYGFVAKGTTVHMYKGDPLPLAHQRIYAYGSTGVYG